MQNVEVCAFGASLTIAEDRPFPCAEKNIGGHRFGQEVVGPGPHGQNAARNVVVTGNKDDWQRLAQLCEALLQLQSRKPSMLRSSRMQAGH